MEGLKMKYALIILDGAADYPVADYGGRTALEIAEIPYLDQMACEGELGLVRTVPEGMEPSSACACLSLMGYDPRVYYRGRAGIEAVGMGVAVGEDEVVFRANLVTVEEGLMRSHSGGYIATSEAGELIRFLNKEIGSEELIFYPGVSYRNLLKIKGHSEVLEAVCTPPHDIPFQPVDKFMPRGRGSEMLLEIMGRAAQLLPSHPINQARIGRGELPANAIWLFWGSGGALPLPPFCQAFGVRAAITSGVDLLRGLGQMMGMEVLDIPGVTDGLDNDYASQAEGALEALNYCDLVVVHVEAPDEAGHSGDMGAKVAAIENIDRNIVARLMSWKGPLRLLAAVDHPTPVGVRTHVAEPVPFVVWGPGIKSNGGTGFNEKGAKESSLFVSCGYKIMPRFIGENQWP